MFGDLTLVSAYIGLLTITNPIGNLPLFLKLVDDQPVAQRRTTILFIGVAVFTILTVASLFGTQILRLFDIDITAFRLAGYVVIVFLAWAMLTAAPSAILRGQRATDVPIVPLAIPALAGPGAISLVISYATVHRSTADLALGLVVIALVAVTVILVFLGGAALVGKLGATGLDILSRVFGLLLLSIAIGGLVSVLGGVFPGWGYRGHG
jgi:multiple antibiotic resistance protein